MALCACFDLSVNGVPIEDYLSGKKKHAMDRRAKKGSQIKGGALFSQMMAMQWWQTNPQAWEQIPRNQRAQMWGLYEVHQFLKRLGEYEAELEAKKKKPKTGKS